MKPGEPYSPYRLFLCAFVPLPIMGMPDLSAGAKLLFGRLALYAGQNTKCYPGLSRLATDLGASVDSIGRWLAELQNAKLLNRAQKGAGKTAECEFTWHSALSAAASAEVQRLNPASAELQNQASAETGDQLPQIRGSASAESRMPLKEEAAQGNGSDKRKQKTAPISEQEYVEFCQQCARERLPIPSRDVATRVKTQFPELWNGCPVWLQLRAFPKQREAIMWLSLEHHQVLMEVERQALTPPKLTPAQENHAIATQRFLAGK